MLTQLKIDNFKSLMSFSLPEDESECLSRFVCLVGLNGAGKSSVLQAIDFLSQLVVGDVAKWLETRGWEKSDVPNKGSKKRNVTFSMKFKLEEVGELEWSGSFNTQLSRCTKEELSFEPALNLKLNALPNRSVNFSYENGVIRSSSGWKRELISDFEGSLFNKLRLNSLGLEGEEPNVIVVLKFLLSGVKSLELLSPQAMRKSSKSAVDVGLGGETLAAFIHGLSGAEKDQLFAELSKFYPRLRSIASRRGKYGWKRLYVGEMYEEMSEFDARHVNDGLLRVAAVVAQTVARSGARNKSVAGSGDTKELGNPDQKGYQFILLDEIENGINPEIVERLINYLMGVRQQVFVTTHSALLLNYLPDDVAQRSVYLIYRRNDGSSGAVRFYEIPEVAHRLEAMGPGEAFLDVPLGALTERLTAS